MKRASRTEREPDGLSRWIRQNPRLWPGEAGADQRRTAGYVHYIRVADSTGSGSRNGGIYVTGTGQRRSAGFPVRPVLVRLGALRDGDRETPLSEKHRSGDTGGHSPGTSRTDRMAKPRRARSAVLGYREVPGERTR